MYKRITRCLFVVVSLLLTGCAASPLIPATGANTAALRLVNLSPYVPVKATEYPGENCNMVGAKSIVNDPVTGASLEPKKTFDTRIPAGQLFNVRSWVVQPTLTCSVTVSFMPQQGKEYVLTFDAQEGKCFIGVGRVERNGVSSNSTVVREESTRKRSAVAGITNGGNICAPELN